ncbi:MAG: amidohydrolase family protein [Pseudomonadota bacterium]
MPGNTDDIRLRNAVVDGRGRVDIAITNGRIAELGPKAANDDGIDLDGALVLPGLFEGHIHLDKTFLGLPWIPHRPDTTVKGRIETEKALRREIKEPMAVRARRMVDHVVACGTTTMRTHVDIDTEIGLDHVTALLELRPTVAHLLDMQIVVFPQSGIVIDPGTADLMEEALRLGCDVVGGLDPAGIDGAVDDHLRTVFGLAEKYSKPVDIHLHDSDELGCFELETIGRYARERGLGGRVAVSHAFALGSVSEPRAQRTADVLAESGVAIMTNGPGGIKTIPPVKLLTDHGVTVFVGSDNIRDAWSPYGNGDILDRARLVGYRAALATDEDLRLTFDLVTGHTAKVMGHPDPVIEHGAPADLIAVRAAHIPEAVASGPPREMVIKAGRIVARNGLLV